MTDWSEHRQEKILDWNDGKHPVLTTTNQPLFWHRVVEDVVTDAYGSLIGWDVLHQQLTTLVTLQAKYADIISPSETLPGEYWEALFTFRYTLDQMAKGPISYLNTGFPASPPIRLIFEREPQVPGSAMIRLRSKGGTDKLMFLMSSLWDDDQRFLHGLPNLMDELERQVESNQGEKDKLSPWIAAMFADLGLIARARHELDIYQRTGK